MNVEKRYNEKLKLLLSIIFPIIPIIYNFDKTLVKLLIIIRFNIKYTYIYILNIEEKFASSKS